ncbi:UDP-N-acetylmuramoylalanyl-D-glutamyl-2,6-diaminopimelate--D-alanyl-D-alanine ligase [Zavarzinia sp. CC-PAN008]|uniref:UDP-N-acetylmuramoylalanyl-D-glutamyl-2, 6-diaminopimelate--D-alanyl-D-alanine ligase n=1 Tax=Zavarzinia sp. CC-PAN008 TaxID=3243332 RepID=UPI003F7427D7
MTAPALDRTPRAQAADALWTAAELAAATGGRAQGDWQATSVEIDSRQVQPGALFLALPGTVQDGHDHAVAALGQGAAGLLVSRPVPGLPPDAPLVMVPDTMAGLTDLAATARARAPARVVAVTGSVGKTGTKDMLALALGRSGPVHASVLSYNNHVGVPLTLARMPAPTRYAVLEIGMNHAGEITPLSRLARPHVAIVTTVEPVHIGHFGSVEAVADAKAEIFAGVAPGGVAVLNRDNHQFDRLAAVARTAGLEIVTFGAEAADVRLLNVVLGDDLSTVQADVAGTRLTYRLGAPGRHLVQNSLAVLAAVRAAGADLALAGLALGEFRAPPGRGRRHQVQLRQGSFTLIDESYNASPVSMRAALDLLARAEPGARGRRIAVLGDMRELGPDATRFHVDLAPAVAAARPDLVFAAGPEMEHLVAALPPGPAPTHRAAAAELIPLLTAIVRPGDVVMVKGSLGSRMQPVTAALLGLAVEPREGQD